MIGTTLIGGQVIFAHRREDCAEDAFCAVHKPSQHCMSTFPQHWRTDRQLMERICPHGVGHPDPDHMAFYAQHHSPAQVAAESTHGCDGCCRGYASGYDA